MVSGPWWMVVSQPVVRWCWCTQEAGWVYTAKAISYVYVFDGKGLMAGKNRVVTSQPRARCWTSGWEFGEEDDFIQVAPSIFICKTAGPWNVCECYITFLVPRYNLPFLA